MSISYEQDQKMWRALELADEAEQRLIEGINDKRPMSDIDALMVAAQHAAAIAAFVPSLSQTIRDLIEIIESQY